MEKHLVHDHQGHRQRLKDRVREYGIHSLKEHEVLELLLTYTIPQKDTNPTAHALLNTFGSLANVLDAKKSELMKVKGIGEETALFLSTLPGIYEMYKQGKNTEKISILKNQDACVRYFRENYVIKNQEYFYIVCLNSSYKVIKTNVIEGNNSSSISVNLKEFPDIVSGKDISAIVLFHTHPFGDVTPSMDDINTTQQIFNMCMVLRIQLCDHIIFNEESYFSFGENMLLDKMRANFEKVFPSNKLTIEGLRQYIGFGDKK